MACTTPSALAAERDENWQYGSATFYGGADGSGTTGGACGYGNLNEDLPGELTTAVSTALFQDGANCGARFKVRCERSDRCLPGQPEVTVVVTNLCPPNWYLSSDNGGWCNPPRRHFELSQPAYSRIAEIRSGIVPISFAEADADSTAPMRYTMNGFPGVNRLTVISNSRWPVKQVSIKGTDTGWLPMFRTQGIIFTTTAPLQGQALSIKVVDTHDRTVISNDVFPANWSFGQTVTAPGF
ncbi:RlpA-like double-psi beta-barrel domain-containing protein [Streptomyces sp. NPDC088789]|uniref:RlpA-like double-psi beta-barrel domain-containing protein n=1 Tax=Streptomyces sp. NPDC088789 TaxID=3365899 RepID=UPI0037F9940D